MSQKHLKEKPKYTGLDRTNRQLHTGKTGKCILQRQNRSFILSDLTDVVISRQQVRRRYRNWKQDANPTTRDDSQRVRQELWVELMDETLGERPGSLRTEREVTGRKVRKSRKQRNSTSEAGQPQMPTMTLGSTDGRAQWSTVTLTNTANCCTATVRS